MIKRFQHCLSNKPRIRIGLAVWCLGSCGVDTLVPSHPIVQGSMWLSFLVLVGGSGLLVHSLGQGMGG